MRRATVFASAVLVAFGLLLGASSLANASIVVYSGLDVGANSTDPRPNSNAAASSFSAAVGSSTLITFESSPVGTFSSLVVSPGVTLTGNDYVNSNTQSIRNSP